MDDLSACSFITGTIDQSAENIIYSSQTMGFCFLLICRIFALSAGHRLFDCNHLLLEGCRLITNTCFSPTKMVWSEVMEY